MMVVQRLQLTVLIAVVLAVGIPASAQTGTPPGKGQIYDSGQRPWVVTKGKIGDLKNASAIIADFDKEEQARAHAQRLREGEAFSSPWYYTYRKRMQDDPQPSFDPPASPPRGKSIEVPKPKPPPSNPGPARPEIDLLGSVWQGNGMTFWFEKDDVLAYKYNNIDYTYRNGSWTFDGQTLTMRIPHMEVAIRTVVKSDQIDTRTIPDFRDQGQVPITFRIRKVSQ